MITRSFFSLLFLPRCIGCEAWLSPSQEESICSACAGKLRFVSLPAHLPHLDKIYFEEAYSAMAYEGWVLDAIHQFKYHRQFHVGRELAALLLKPPLKWDSYEALAFVPLHWRRQIRRGFNPSQFLAACLGAKLRKPVVSLLKRMRPTPSQTKLSQKERLQNVRGAFAVKKPLSKNILLIDDVLTTGSTVNECAKALIQTGAKKVGVLTVARSL